LFSHGREYRGLEVISSPWEVDHLAVCGFQSKEGEHKFTDEYKRNK
jgi:hypothetical protein